MESLLHSFSENDTVRLMPQEALECQKTFTIAGEDLKHVPLRILLLHQRAVQYITTTVCTYCGFETSWAIANILIAERLESPE